MQVLKTILLISIILSSSNVQAQTNTGDTAWILTSSSLVLFMTLPGLALFYAGLVCSRNVLSVLSQHFAIACLMSILWIIMGYSLAFSGDGSGLFGELMAKMFHPDNIRNGKVGDWGFEDMLPEDFSNWK